MGPRNEQEARQAKALTGIALTTLAARAGGIIEIPVSEFDEAVERYGGKGNATMFVEMLEGRGPEASPRQPGQQEASAGRVSPSRSTTGAMPGLSNIDTSASGARQCDDRSHGRADPYRSSPLPTAPNRHAASS